MTADLLQFMSWGIAAAAYPGESESGDLAVVAPFSHGALLGVVDGLGHGPEAAAAARTAAETLTKHAGESPITLVERCHDRLRKTRGAAMSIASLDAIDSTLTWLAVGNVEGLLVRGELRNDSKSVLLRAGVVGLQLPSLAAEVLPIDRDDTLVFATDGVRPDFRRSVSPERDPKSVADAILERYGRATDDACVLVARYMASAEASFVIREEADLVAVRRCIRRRGHEVGLSEVEVEAVATAATEIGQNILTYAGAGEIRVKAAHDERTGLVIVAVDGGPGIADPARAMEDGYSTGGTLGLGLSSAKRLVDEFELSSTVGRGTTVTLKKWRRP